jgi:hypothetical protein
MSEYIQVYMHETVSAITAIVTRDIYPPFSFSQEGFSRFHYTACKKLNATPVNEG